MTREEAIQELERQYLAITEYGNITTESKALRMAIKSMEYIDDHAL